MALAEFAPVCPTGQDDGKGQEGKRTRRTTRYGDRPLLPSGTVYIRLDEVDVPTLHMVNEVVEVPADVSLDRIQLPVVKPWSGGSSRTCL